MLCGVAHLPRVPGRRAVGAVRCVVCGGAPCGVWWAVRRACRAAVDTLVGAARGARAVPLLAGFGVSSEGRTHRLEKWWPGVQSTMRRPFVTR